MTPPGPTQLLVVLLVVVLLFGAKKLPDLARSVGQSTRVLKGEMRGLKEDEDAAKPETQALSPSLESESVKRNEAA